MLLSQSRLICRSTLILAGLLHSVHATADEPVPVRTGIHWLDWATEQVAFTLREAAPGDGEATETAPAADPLMATHSIETIEIQRLQQEIVQLRLLIEQEFIDRIINLESELREVKLALQGQLPPGSAGRPIIPRPDNLPSPAPYAGEAPPPELAMPDPEAESLPAVPAEPFSFTAVDEWGRSPEVVAELGGDATTLIGLAGVVPPGSTKEDVVALARELRAKYDAYDNINIEIFDTTDAAGAFAERQTVDSGHHVASISRHKASGRDTIVYLGGAQPEAVPLAGE